MSAPSAKLDKVGQLGVLDANFSSKTTGISGGVFYLNLHLMKSLPVGAHRLLYSCGVMVLPFLRFILFSESFSKTIVSKKSLSLFRH